MRRLLIIGAGGFGREVWQWARTQEQTQRSPWHVGGFLDADTSALAGFGLSAPVLGDPASYTPAPGDCFVCAIGDPSIRLQLSEGLRKRAGQFVNVIHPAAVVASESRLGEGCILCPGAVVSAHARLGDYVLLNLHATVGHDAVLGDGSTLACHADVTGKAVLARGVFIGSHGSVLPGVKVGEFAIVSAGSVAFRDVPAYATVIGVPARVLHTRRPSPQSPAP